MGCLGSLLWRLGGVLERLVGVLGLLGGRLGCVFASSWRRLEPSWARLGRILARLGASGAHLGASWGRLGGIFWPSCAIGDRSEAKPYDFNKTPLKPMKFNGFSKVAGAMLAPSWPKKPSWRVSWPSS